MINIKKIRKLVEDHYEIDLSTKSRYRTFTYPRMLFYGLCEANAYNFTPVAVARELGFNHATVYHGLRSFHAMFGTKHWDRRFNESYLKLNKEIEEMECNTAPMDIRKLNVIYDEVS